MELARATLQLREKSEKKSLKDSIPQDQQVVIFSCGSQIIFVFGGNRSGKSHAGALVTAIKATGIIPDAIKPYWKGKIVVPADIWVAGIDFPSLTSGPIKKIFQLIPREMIEHYDRHTHVLKLTNGSTITFKSYENGAVAFQSADLDHIWCDEEPPKDVYDECTMRLVDRSGTMIVTETPTQGVTWTHDEIYLKEFELPDTKIIFLDTEQNPYLPQEELEKIKKRYTKEELEMRLKGRFVSKTGVIFQISEEVNVCEPFKIPWDWNRFRVIDPGIGHPTGCVWIAVSPLDQWFLYREYLVPDLSVPQNAKAIIEMSKMIDQHGQFVPEDIVTTILDPNSGGARQESTGQTIQSCYLENGIPSVLGNDDVNAGIDHVRQVLLPLGGGKSKLQIFRTCTMTLRTMRGYVWGSTKVNGVIHSTGKPKKINDEIPDCTRYFTQYDPRYQSPAERVAYDGEEQGVQSSLTGY